MTAAYRRDGRVVDAASFYALACDPRRSVAVEACAGAGKTWMLVSRIVRALLDGAEPSQILAITFTRKAAGEMRQRLDQWLAEWAAPMSDDTARVGALTARGVPLADAVALAPMLGGLQGRVLAQARRVDIRTFHGWFGQLLAQAPLADLQRLGMAPGLRLIEDSEQLRDDLFRAFHRQVHADDGLRDDYLSLVRRHRRHAVQRWLDAAWQRRTEIEAAADAGTLANSVPPASAVFADCAVGRHPLDAMLDPDWRAELQALALALGARGKGLSDRAAERLQDALAAETPASAFDLARNALMTDKGLPRQKMGDLVAQQQAVDRLLAISQRASQQDAHDDHLRMVRLSAALLDQYRQLKQGRALADMGDLETVALTLLADGDLSAWIQARLDQRLRHLLIDEFQDTSPVQWQALQGWLSGYAGAGGGSGLSVFIVGDPKQSIYRFRRAEPRVFASARNFVTEALAGSVLECDHTRRNAPQIIEALNCVFQEAADHDGWSGFRSHSTESTEPGTVRRLPMPDRAPRDPGADADDDVTWRDSLTVPRHSEDEARRLPEARQVAWAIAQLLAEGSKPGEIMVLARRRSALALVAQSLAECHLPFTMPEALSLQTSVEAQDLLAVLDVLASPGHDLSLARALRSPIFGVTDADLLTLANAASDSGGWWLALQSAQPAVTASAALSRARRLLAAWAVAAAQLPPHDLLDRIVHEGEVMERLAAALPARLRRGALAAVDALLAAALDIDGGRYITPYRFVRALRRHDVQARLPSPADAVRLLTVHGAKGLEARWVFVIDAHPQARAPERTTLLIDWPTECRAPSTVAFVAREGAIAPSLRPLLEAEQAARLREEVNGLYVAMTRAEAGLILSGSAPMRPDPRSWWARIEPLAEPWTPVAPMRHAVEDAPIMVPALPALTRPGRISPVVLPPATSPAAQLGQAAHRALEWIGRPGAPLARSEWDRLADAAAREFGLAGQGEAVVAMIESVMGSAVLRPFFEGPALRWAGNELPLSDGGRPVRLDRLVLIEAAGQRHWWVLDYKLSSRPQEVLANREQLAAYLAAVRRAQPGDRVSGGFITGQGELIQID